MTSRRASLELTRHLKSGKNVVSSQLTMKMAREYAGRMLVDNGVLSRAAAQVWAASIVLGVRLDHPSGYGVTVREEQR